jgi:integrase
MPRRSTTRITEKTVKTKPREKPFEIRDCDLRGFILRIQPTSTKTFYAEWGKGQRSRIGDAALMTVTAAREEAAQRIAGAKRGEIPKPKIRNRVPTLRKFIDKQYKVFALANQKAGATNVQRIKGSFAGLLNKRIDTLSSFVFEKWKSARLKDGIARSTVNRDLTMLRAALNKAVEWGVIDVNPLDGVKPYKRADNERVRWLSPDEEKRLTAALDERENKLRRERKSGNEWRAARHEDPLPEIGDDEFANHLKPMVLLARNTGLRFTEMSRLKWTDVNLGEKPILTAHAANTKDDKTRSVPLNKTALATLRQWKAQQEKTAGFVFANADGTRIKKLRNSWIAVLEKAEISDFRWHDLRHDFASKLVTAGVDLNTVRELMGHASIDMTLRYAHLAPDRLATAVKALDAKPETESTKEEKEAVQRTR